MRRALSRFATFLTRNKVPAPVVELAELLVAEALNNVVEHAYPEAKARPFRMAALLKPGWIAVTLEDSGVVLQGIAFPGPKDQPTTRLTRINDLPEGGYGWRLLNDHCLNISYTRTNGRNRLCLLLPRETARV